MREVKFQIASSMVHVTPEHEMTNRKEKTPGRGGCGCCNFPSARHIHWEIRGFPNFYSVFVLVLANDKHLHFGSGR